MKKAISTLIASVMLITQIPCSEIAAAYADRDREWIVEFTSVEKRDAYIEKYGGEELGGTYALTHGGEITLSENAFVRSVTENCEVYANADGIENDDRIVVTNDELSDQQFYLWNDYDGYDYFNGFYSDSSGINAGEAWRIMDTFLAENELTPQKCSPVRVAVIDSGIDATHEDLSARVTAGYDAVNDCVIPDDTDSDVSTDSHGTKVAGLIAAEADNNKGISGAAYLYPVELIPVRALNKNNKGETADVIRAINWAVEEGNADIINLSFGNTMDRIPAAMQSAIDNATEKGIIVVAAAGNDGKEFESFSYNYYPAALNGVMAVGSVARTVNTDTGRSKEKMPEIASFSNRMSDIMLYGQKMYMLPGEDLITTARGDSYQIFKGTSASAALMSGMLAAVKSYTASTNGTDAAGCISAENYSSGFGDGRFETSYTTYVSAACLASEYTKNPAYSSWVSFYGDTETVVRGTEKFRLLFCDRGSEYTEIRVKLWDNTNFKDVILCSVPRNGNSLQLVNFSFDSEKFEDDRYCFSVYGVREDGTEDAVMSGPAFSKNVTVDNKQNQYTVKVTCQGVPVARTEFDIYGISCLDENGSYITEYRAFSNESGMFTVSKNMVSSGKAFMFVKTDEFAAAIPLGTAPAEGDTYEINADPTSITVSAGEELYENLAGHSISMFAGDKVFELYEFDENNKEINLYTTMDVSLGIMKRDMILIQPVETDSDTVWNVDKTFSESAEIKVSPDTSFERGRLILQLGDRMLSLPSEGGTAHVTANTYDVYTYCVKMAPENSETGVYAKTHPGIMKFEGNTEITVGTGIKGSIKLADEAVHLDEEFKAEISFTDSQGLQVLDWGRFMLNDYEDNLTENLVDSDLSSIVCLKKGTASENGEYSYEEIEFYRAAGEVNTVSGTVTVHAPGERIGNPGRYRICYTPNRYEENHILDDLFCDLTVLSQDSRPSVDVSINTPDSFSKWKIYSYLKDEEGNPIIRKSVEDRNDYSSPEYITLPAGCVYDLFVYREAEDENGSPCIVMGMIKANLTEAEAGSKKTIEITESDILNEWDMTKFNCIVSDPDTLRWDTVREIVLSPFAQAPDMKVSIDCDNRYMGIYSLNIGKTLLEAGIKPDSENVVFTVSMEADLSAKSELSWGAEGITPAIKTEKVKYTVGEPVTITCDYRDGAGNLIVDAFLSENINMTGSGRGENEGRNSISPVIVIKDSSGSDAAVIPVEKFGSAAVDNLKEGSYSAYAKLEITGDRNRYDYSSPNIYFTVGSESHSVTEVPYPPEKFTVSAGGEGVLNLAWSVPAGYFEGYVLMRDGIVIAELNKDAVSYTDEGLSSERYYSYSVCSIGKNGVKSRMKTACARPAAGPDTEAPSVPEGLTVKYENNSISVSWNRSSDNTGVTGYILSVNGNDLEASYQRKYTMRNLAPGMSYSFTVRAADGAGNESEQSEPKTVKVSEDTAVSDIELEYNTNRLGVIIGQDISVSAYTTTDVVSADAVISYNNEKDEPKIFEAKMSFNGECWNVYTELPFFTEITSVQVIANTAKGNADGKYTGNMPLLRADTFTVRLYPTKEEIPEQIDLSECSVTLSSGSLGYSRTASVRDFSGEASFALKKGDDYKLTVTDRNGIILYAKNNVKVTDAAVYSVNMDDLSFISLNLSYSYKDVHVSLIDEDSEEHNVIATGVTDENGEVVFSSGKKWTSALKGGKYMAVLDKYKFLGENGFYYTVEKSEKVFSAESLFTAFRIDTRPFVSSTIECSVFVFDATGSAGISGVTVDITSDTETKSAVTDENGKVTVKIQSYGGSIAAGVKKQEISEGRYIEADTVKTVSDNMFEKVMYINTSLYVKDVIVKADLKVREEGKIIDYDKSFLAGNPVQFKINGKNCSVVSDDTFICYNSYMKHKQNAEIEATVFNGDKQYKVYSTFLSDFSKEVCDCGEILFDDGKVAVTLQNGDPGSDTVRFLIFNEDTGETVFDIVTKKSESVILDADVNYLFINTKNIYESISYNTWKDSEKSGVIRRIFERGENSVLKLKSSDYKLSEFNLSDFIVPHQNGFSGHPSVTWLDDENVRVCTRITIHYKKVEDAKDYHTVLRLPEGAYDFTYDDSCEKCETDGRDLYFYRVDDNRWSWDIVSVSYKISVEKLLADPVMTLYMGVYYDNKEYIFTVMNQTVSFSPVKVMTKPKITKSDIEKNGLKINLGTNIIYDRKPGWNVSIFEDGKAVYSVPLEYMPDSIIIKNIDSTLRKSKITAKIEKNGVVYTDECSFEIVYDKRPVIKSATINGEDLTDKITPVCIRNTFSDFYAEAEFTNPELVKNVRITAETESGFNTIPLKWNGNIFTGTGRLGDESHPLFGVDIEYDEIMDENTVFSELDISGLNEGSFGYFLPEGAVVEQLPESLGGSPEQHAEDLADWEKYLKYVENGVFSEGTTAEAVDAAFDDLFGKDGIWYLPAYKTADGYYMHQCFVYDQTDKKEFGENDLYSNMLVGDEERIISAAASVSENQISVEISGMGDLLFPTHVGEQMSACEIIPYIPDDVKEAAKKINSVENLYKTAKTLYGFDPCKPEVVRACIEAVADHSPYGFIMKQLVVWAAMKLYEDFAQRPQNINHEVCAVDAMDSTKEFCGKDPCRPQTAAHVNNPKPVNSLVDPSGFIFEAAEDNTLEGVTATVYMKTGSGWYKWNSEMFGEPANPTITEENGKYGWNVLPGEWKVIFEKEGYYPAESITLAVMPEHLDVNISMVANTKPEISKAYAMSDGKTIIIEFDKYMTISDLAQTGAVSIYSGTNRLEAVLSALDSRISTSGNKQSETENTIKPGVEIARRFKITLEDPLPAGSSVKLTVSGECTGYNCIAIGDDAELSFIIPEIDPEISADRIFFSEDSYRVVNKGDTFSLSEILVTEPAESNISIDWISADESVASVDKSGNVTAAGEGSTLITAKAGDIETVYAVLVKRSISNPSAENNIVKFCRQENLVIDKACWVIGEGANAELENPEEGDTRFLPVSWNVYESEKDGEFKLTSEGKVKAGENDIQAYYIPRTEGGKCKAVITFKEQKYVKGEWEDTENTCEKECVMPITSVTGIKVKAFSGEFRPGDVIDLSTLVLSVSLSDGSVSEVPFKKINSYGISLSLENGKNLTADDSQLVIEHTKSGIKDTVKLFDKTGAAPPDTAEGSFLKGDVSFDGNVNAVDIALMSRYILNPPDEEDIHYDLNGDSAVDASDLTVLVNIILNY